MLTTHELPESAFSSLAKGGGDPETIRLLRYAQQDKHLMILVMIGIEAMGSDRGSMAFRAAYKLLTRLEGAGTGAHLWLLDLPHMGGWAHDCMMKITHGDRPDIGHFANLVAAAAVRIGMPFELDVPVRDGCVPLPGLGTMRIAEDTDWITMSCDGDYVNAGTQFKAEWQALLPDHGSGRSIPGWSGTPMLRAAAGRLIWEVLLETAYPYLDRYPAPMNTSIPPKGIRRWRQHFQLAWELLVRQHRWAAESMADGISVIVPLVQDRDTDLVSATTPAAFGAISTSWPPDPVTLAETLVHEFQHVKLGGIMDMVQLVEPSSEQAYAPWRLDPRPADALLQGVYAHLGIERFWLSQCDSEKDQDEILRAQAQFFRWRSAIELAIRTMVRARCLTPHGLRFVYQLYTWEKHLTTPPVASTARKLAEEAALDHWLTWQIRHVAINSEEVATLAAAYQRGDPSAASVRPGGQIVADIRTVNASAVTRSRLLTTRYLAPARFRDLSEKGDPLPDRADILLVDGESDLAVQAYSDRIASSTEPQPEAWIGLALAMHQLPETPMRHIFATQLALLYELHWHLTSQGGRYDPLDLARWLA